jgi:hypothetical protein
MKEEKIAKRSCKYKIIRVFQDPKNPLRWMMPNDPSRRTIKTGLTLKQAQGHCRSKETSSSTCTTADAKQVTIDTLKRGYEAWFDCYEVEGHKEHERRGGSFSKAYLHD